MYVNWNLKIVFAKSVSCIGLTAVLVFLNASPLHAAEIINLYEFVMKAGDDTAWSSPTLDDSEWESTYLRDVPDLDSSIWLRTKVELAPQHFVEGKPLGIYIAAMASHEIWWDGECIARGGVVGRTPESEQPGPIQAHYVIPDRLAANGVHTVAIRVSAFHRHFVPSTGYWGVLVGEYDRIARVGMSRIRIALISLSGMLMMAIFAVMMFVQNPNDKSFLFLGLLCVSGALLLVAESYRGLFGYTYNWHLLRLSVVTALAWILDVVLLVFLSRRFPMKGAKWFVLAGITGATIPIFTSHAWDPKAANGFLCVFALSAVWCAAAVRKRLPGSFLALLGVTFCLGGLLVSPLQFVDRNLYLALDFLLVCLLASHVLQVRQVRREREEALVKSARLEVELLKKHIQPHFLMNTLTALSEWIEEEPRKAGKLIQSLADEFRVLSDISNQSLIRMEDEIRLCQSHVEIMSHRKGREYRLETSGIDPTAQIPPAVIHTLVENAITHSDSTGERVAFRLSEERRENRRCYVFESPFTPQTDGGAFDEGTGLRYIKARLQESFGENWSLGSGPEASNWRTEILVPA